MILCLTATILDFLTVHISREKNESDGTSFIAIHPAVYILGGYKESYIQT